MIPSIGPMEIAVLLLVVLLVFGPKRLPELGNSLGRGIRSFRGAVGDGNADKSEAQSSDQSQHPGA